MAKVQAHLLVELLLPVPFLATHTYAACQLHQTGLEKSAGKLSVTTAVLEALANVLEIAEPALTSLLHAESMQVSAPYVGSLWVSTTDG